MVKGANPTANEATGCEASMEQTPLSVDSAAVRAHIEIMLDVVNRIAANSRSCKVWCITIVSAILALVSRTENSAHVLLALVPAVLFLILDTYYLALERGFRRSYDEFVDTLHEGRLYATRLYSIRQCGSIYRRSVASLMSFSIWPFYLCVTTTVILAWMLIS